MSVRHSLVRVANEALSRVGLKLERMSRDFDARLDRTEHVARIFRELGGEFDRWLAEQQLFQVKRRFSSADAITTFYSAYLSAPFRDQSGGSRFNNLVWLYLIAKVAAPSVIVDSGTYRGASAWAFSLGCPDAAIFSFDIDLSRLALRAPGVQYLEHDWTKADWRGVDLSQALIYFDDHLDQAKRLIEAAEHGIGLAVFDDDFPLTSFASMAHDGSALPKIEFLLDDELLRASEISWIDRGVRRVIPVQRDYWERARGLIVDTERLPNTSLVTGIHQTPYRIVRVRVGPAS